MPGFDINPASVNHKLGQVTCAVRDVMTSVQRFIRAIEALGADDPARYAVLIAPPPDGKGLTETDATFAILMKNYLRNLAGVYYGTVPQGDPPTLFSFDEGLAGAWGMG